MNMFILDLLSRKRVLVVLIIIFFVSLLLRFYKLDSIPKGALVDEASYGYIAYSLLHTGKDERGVSMPLHFQAFGDQKLPAYAYILVPIVKIFGLNNFSTRLPSALSGALLVLIIYGLLRSMKLKETESLFGALVTAVSPWTLVLSRFAFESNVALLFFTAGLWALFSTFQSKQIRYLYLTAIFFAITWYAYVPYRVITSLIFLSYGAILWRNKLFPGTRILGALFLMIALVIPLLPQTFNKTGTARLNQVGLFTNEGIVHSINDRRGYCETSLPPILCKLLVNKPIVIAGQFLSNQVRSLSPEFLFLSGEKDILYLSVPEYGAFPFILLPLFLCGGIVLSRKLLQRTISPIYLIILVSLCIATLPNALVGPPQRVRLSALAPFVILLISMGFGAAVRHITVKTLNIIFTLFMPIAVLVAGLFFVVDLYFVHIPKLKLDYASEVPGVMNYIYTNAGKHTVYFDQFNDNYPIFYAYFNRINPYDYQKYAMYSDIDSGGFSHPIGYKNLMRPDKPLPALICDGYQKGESFYFVTSEPMRNMGIGPELPVYTELSGDRRSAVSYVYHINPRTYKNQCSAN